MSVSNISSTTRESIAGRQIEHLTQELETIRTVNENLRTYLENIRRFSKNLRDVNENYSQLSKVNTQWIDLISNENLK